MSILLDAVIRDKQQKSTNVIDPVMTSHAVVPRQRDNRGYVWTAIMLAAVILGLVLAWGMSRWGEFYIDSTVANEKTQATVTGADIRALHNKKAAVLPPADSVAEVRIAAKVALPIAQPVATASLSSEPMTSPNSSLQREAKSTAVDPQPIILGAQPNQRGQQLLSKLRQQQPVTSSRADKAKISTTDVDQSRSSDNLVAAFQAALQEVEFNESIETDVTQAELDPIPQQSTLRPLPKYGQLPPRLQSQVPEFTINAHVYASAAHKRWLNVDGVELQQGDSIQGKLTIVEIRPRDIVLQIEETQFKVPAI